MFSGSYKKDDVTFLMKIVDVPFTGIKEKEEKIQLSNVHYSEMISDETEPSPEYMKHFHHLNKNNLDKLCTYLYRLAFHISQTKGKLTLVSLARAGTPIGVLLLRVLRDVFKRQVRHYSISIIRDKGIDSNALKHIVSMCGDENIFFVDGWTGKGVIANELYKSVVRFNINNKTRINPGLYVLADICGKSKFASTHDDFLISSCVLNSTISGLVSRSILNSEYISSQDFHGCLFYSKFKHCDLSNWFIETTFDHFFKLLIKNNLSRESQNNTVATRIDSLCYIRQTMDEYNISNINYIKPGLGETTRVLLRRVPFKVILKNSSDVDVRHIVQLCKEKSVPITIKNMPYKALAIIKDLNHDK